MLTILPKLVRDSRLHVLYEPTFRKVGLGRAARTDAGVHAAGNVVSMKLIKDIPGVQDMVARINEELPPEIRLWSIVSRILALYTHALISRSSEYLTTLMHERMSADTQVSPVHNLLTFPMQVVRQPEVYILLPVIPDAPSEARERSPPGPATKRDGVPVSSILDCALSSRCGERASSKAGVPDVS